MVRIHDMLKAKIQEALLDEFLEQELERAGYGGFEMVRTPIGTRLTLHVIRPGIVIGRRASGIAALSEKLEENFSIDRPQISVVEVEVPELNPRIMVSRLAAAIQRGVRPRRAARWILRSIMEAGAMGAEIVVKGKIRTERSHYEKHTAGYVPKSGDFAIRVVKEAKKQILLKHGVMGLRVRIVPPATPPDKIEVVGVSSGVGEGSEEAP